MSREWVAPFSLDAPNLPGHSWVVMFAADPSAPSGASFGPEWRWGNALGNLIGDIRGIGRCIRCNRSWMIADPGDGIPLNRAGDVSPWLTGRARFALCMDCEREVGWSGRRTYDAIMQDIWVMRGRAREWDRGA